MAIPEPAKTRLLHLLALLEREGKTLTSTRAEALTGWTRDTIRKDISHLGAEGGAGSGAGYAPESLVPLIRRALALDRKRRCCVVGLGRLGSAYVNYREDAANGEFELVAGFDINVNRLELLSAPVPLYPAYKMGEVISRFGIEIALLCVPADAAEAAAEKLAGAGIRGILNFAPVMLSLPAACVVRNVSVMDELRSLAIKLP
ncbi:MAG: CoA-binding protein [Spirochaetaceae bacterium]|jgi:redox-sensing transcriptional repressor|nr:CoA-binding protein [Spirochaetaceae bacterium]